MTSLMKYFPLLILALCIDGLQAALTAALAVTTLIAGAAAPLVGGAAGAGGGCLVGAGIGAASTAWLFGVGALGGGVAGCATGAAIGWWGGSVAGTAAAAAIGPLGTMLGFAISVCLSFTLGFPLVILMAGLYGMWYPKKIIPAMLGEIIPGLDVLPAWTALVVLCVMEKSKEEGKGLARIAALAAPLALQNQEKLFGSKVGQIARGARKGTVVGMRGLAKMIPGKEITSLVAVLAFCFFAAAPARAQTLGGQPDPVQFIISPETPGPNQPVSIEVQGVGTFLGDAAITWSRDGAVAKTGLGETTFTFTTGRLGSGTRVHVDIHSPAQGAIARDFTFVPSLVNLLWEADTTVPNFYLGKALYSAGSSARVVAYPTVYANGALVQNNKLSFQWSRNGDAVPAQSGLGKNIFAFDGDELNSAEDVAVDLYLGGAKVARGEASIPATDPQTVVYDLDPLRGELLDLSLPSAFNLASAEITVKAEPYYFARASKQSGALSFAWTLDDSDTGGPQSAQGILTLRQSGQGQGSAALGVTIQNNNNDQLVQQAAAALQVLFGGSNAAPSALGL